MLRLVSWKASQTFVRPVHAWKRWHHRSTAFNTARSMCIIASHHLVRCYLRPASDRTLAPGRDQNCFRRLRLQIDAMSSHRPVLEYVPRSGWLGGDFGHNLSLAPPPDAPVFTSMTVNVEQLRQALAKSARRRGAIRPVSRALYSTDASVYQIEPLGVVVPQNRGRRGPHGGDCAAAWRVDHGARRRHVAGRPGDWRRPASRHLEISEPRPRGECGRALGLGRARRRARRAERATASARTAIRARHLHRQPRHHRRHDREQLERRAVGALRQDHRPRSGAAASCSPTDPWRISARLDAGELAAAADVA